MPGTAHSNGYHDAYLESEVLSADPVDLIRILYRAAIEAIRTARGCLKRGEIRGRSRQITRALTILAELELSVDRSRDPDLAANLVELYDYLERLLHEANCRQTDPPLAQAEGLLATLLEAWSDAQTQPAGRVVARRVAALTGTGEA